ncbi:hypothetical protein F4560_007930 [Saccharothrix ecbatanensis]|uniref:Uncharacterized protein n=1 Tax=Saccharothrix ecbatanensis TaxID=1105145 RepID=A0A7W9HTG1_9PSEU|nr:hypothetical protein [Saccharothrix ecbatanensis]
MTSLALRTTIPLCRPVVLPALPTMFPRCRLAALPAVWVLWAMNPLR